MKEIRKVFLVLILICVNAASSIGQDKISYDTISAYFGEIKANTGNYKALWNIDLYGPLLLVDPKTRVVYSNFPDSTGILKQDGEIFTGILPIDINVANTAITWSGKTWAIIMFPLPSAKPERLDLLSHELFHRSQPILGFKMGNPANSHLDQKDGRIYLRLELEALRQAVGSKSQTEISRHISNALSFRNHRYAIYNDAKASENSLELNEGLATYTGIFMSGRDDNQIKDYLGNKIAEFQSYPTFVRSFAYLTIPLYGNLLSKSDKYWNHQIDNNTNLTDFFIRSFGLEIPDNPGIEIMNQYGLSTINAEETKREERIKQLISDYKAKFIVQPHLEIRFEKMNVSFDPRNIMPIEGFGTVYPTMRVSDNWGILTVTGGALLGTNWDKITLSEPTLINANKVTGDGWTIDLNSGYFVERNGSDKNYSLNKEVFPQINDTDMVLIPAGAFIMGKNSAGTTDWQPEHKVAVDAFYMDKYEVTNQQYYEFCTKAGHPFPEFWGSLQFKCSLDYPDHPVVGVSFSDAIKYAQWAGKRLPTEAEWEYAARGGLINNNYPWGNQIDSTLVNYGKKYKTTLKVGSFKSNGYGLFDMGGNVWEWTMDNYGPDYYANSPVQNPTGPDSGRFKLIRGGSWHSGAMCIQTYYRNGLPASWVDFAVGFRCVKNAKQ